MMDRWPRLEDRVEEVEVVAATRTAEVVQQKRQEAPPAPAVPVVGAATTASAVTASFPSIRPAPTPRSAVSFADGRGLDGTTIMRGEQQLRQKWELPGP